MFINILNICNNKFLRRKNIARLNKSYFSMFKKKTLTFQEVKSNEDVRGEIVKSNYDYRVDITKNDPRSKDVIKVRFVTSGGDVRLQVDDRNGDFSIYMK